VAEREPAPDERPRLGAAQRIVAHELLDERDGLLDRELLAARGDQTDQRFALVSRREVRVLQDHMRQRLREVVGPVLREPEASGERQTGDPHRLAINVLGMIGKPARPREQVAKLTGDEDHRLGKNPGLQLPMLFVARRGHALDRREGGPLEQSLRAQRLSQHRGARADSVTQGNQELGLGPAARVELGVRWTGQDERASSVCH
jgi:hypothetical protein